MLSIIQLSWLKDNLFPWLLEHLKIHIIFPRIFAFLNCVIVKKTKKFQEIGHFEKNKNFNKICVNVLKDIKMELQLQSYELKYYFTYNETGK